MAVAHQHVQQHMQKLQQKAQGQAQAGGGATSPEEVRERGGEEGNIISMVRGNAQAMSQQLQRAPGQN